MPPSKFQKAKYIENKPIHMLSKGELKSFKDESYSLSPPPDFPRDIFKPNSNSLSHFSKPKYSMQNPEMRRLHL
jgi:hypothetical protein